MTILIDSDVLIEVLRGRDAGILEKWTGLANSSDAVLCSPVSVAEIWHGARPRSSATLRWSPVSTPVPECWEAPNFPQA
jgi:predicted nucleic acid-binding protein